MKKMILTGLSSVQNFAPNGNGHVSLGNAEFYLVFNDGELQVKVSQEAAEAVIKAMASDDEVDHVQEEDIQEQSVEDYDDEAEADQI